VKKINSALISVFYKDGLEPIVKTLFDQDVTIYSTGGTAKFIRDLGIDVVDVEAFTNYPSILGGRVKTLHPKVFGGILARRDFESDRQQLKEYDIPEIDLVIVDLYPFEETVKNTDNEAEIIEKIDIGGIALIRATAKNYNDTLVVASRNQYEDLLNLLTGKNGSTELEDRRKFAALAFHVSSHYDTAIFNYFSRNGEQDFLKISLEEKTTLRYGENPHQKGLFFGRLDELFDQLNGKAISYNNLVDIDAAIHLIDEFDETTFAILKHTNSCGLALRDNIKDAWEAALAGDPVSAFGGVVICNRDVDEETAKEINKIFIEVLIAPGYSDAALEILKSKKNRIILKRKAVGLPKMQMKTILNGVVMQDYDQVIEDAAQFKFVTDKRPDERETEDLVFALKAIKHIKSNGITLTKNKQLIGSGTGQTSRVDALKQSIEKARHFGFDPKGAVLASDAFFPFADSVELAGKAGITAVVQPGGSIRDQDSIDYCNQHGLAMIMTGVRHFKH
jgi:phosphoribosylaminoimidazolecarboxamide formyltransferase / IMP cyclohydrolase